MMRRAKTTPPIVAPAMMPALFEGAEGLPLPAVDVGRSIIELEAGAVSEVETGVVVNLTDSFEIQKWPDI